MANRKTQKERIFSYIQRRPRSGATRRELSYDLRILHQSVGPRVVELLEEGMIEPSGKFRDGCAVLVARGSNAAQ